MCKTLYDITYSSPSNVSLNMNIYHQMQQEVQGKVAMWFYIYRYLPDTNSWLQAAVIFMKD